MSLNERYSAEKAKWDVIAAEQSKHLSVIKPGENFDQFAKKDPQFSGVSEFLGDLKGKRVLEIGCGAGKIAVLMAKSGAQVTAFDLSPHSVRVARESSLINETVINFAVSAGEHLPFADGSFDVIYGKAILHHLDINIGKCDLYRVLKNDGKAVFIEPMGMNPLLTFARKYAPYPHKNPVGVDRPLTYADMDSWTESAKFKEYREVQLLSMIERGFGWGMEFPVLRKIDEYLLKNVPFLRRFCRYVVIYSIK